jgi:hypothetical protein
MAKHGHFVLFSNRANGSLLLIKHGCRPLGRKENLREKIE